MEFRKELENAINSHSKENESNTPDFILAEYLVHCLLAFDLTTKARDKWYGIKPEPGWDRSSISAKPKGERGMMDCGKCGCDFFVHTQILNSRWKRGFCIRAGCRCGRFK